MFLESVHRSPFFTPYKSDSGKKVDTNAYSRHSRVDFRIVFLIKEMVSACGCYNNCAYGPYHYHTCDDIAPLAAVRKQPVNSCYRIRRGRGSRRRTEWNDRWEVLGYSWDYNQQ